MSFSRSFELDLAPPIIFDVELDQIAPPKLKMSTFAQLVQDEVIKNDLQQIPANDVAHRVPECSTSSLQRFITGVFPKVQRSHSSQLFYWSCNKVLMQSSFKPTKKSSDDLHNYNNESMRSRLVTDSYSSISCALENSGSLSLQDSKKVQSPRWKKLKPQQNMNPSFERNLKNMLKKSISHELAN